MRTALKSELVGLLFALLIAATASINIGYTLLQYYDRENIGWNNDSLEYLDYYYGEPVRGVVHYRVLTIWIAKAIPDMPDNFFSDVRGDNRDWQALLKFALVNVIALTVLGPVLYLHQRQLGLAPPYSWLGLCVFFLSRPILQSTTIPMTEAIALLTWLLVAYAMLIDNLWLLLISYAIGLFNKETILLITVLAPLTVHPWKTKIKQCIPLAGLTLFYLAFRSTLLPGAATSYNFNLNQIDRWDENIRMILSVRGLFDLFTAFGFVWFIFVYGLYRRYVQPELRWWLLLVPILLGFVVLLSGNLGRSILLAFPVVIPVAMWTLQQALSPYMVSTKTEEAAQ